MARPEVIRPRLLLSDAELAEVVGEVKQLIGTDTKNRTQSLADNFRSQSRFRDLFQTWLKYANLDVDRLKAATRKEFATLQAERIARAKLQITDRAKTAVVRADAVWGDRFGVVRPPYELLFADHHIEGPPLDFTAIADPNTGRLQTSTHCQDSRPKMVDTFAGVGFWYVPNTNGMLNINIAASIHEFLWTHAEWFDTAASGAWITLAIASYLREPFQFVRWETQPTNQLAWLTDTFEHSTDHTEEFSSYGMSAATFVDTAHYYACYAWVRLYSYAENGGGASGGALTAVVPGFSFNLT